MNLKLHWPTNLWTALILNILGCPLNGKITHKAPVTPPLLGGFLGYLGPIFDFRPVPFILLLPLFPPSFFPSSRPHFSLLLSNFSCQGGGQSSPMPPLVTPLGFGTLLNKEYHHKLVIWSQLQEVFLLLVASDMSAHEYERTMSGLKFTDLS